jgi:hypothetical protein
MTCTVIIRTRSDKVKESQRFTQNAIRTAARQPGGSGGRDVVQGVTSAAKGKQTTARGSGKRKAELGELIT